jgi:hypothetical protein
LHETIHFKPPLAPSGTLALQSPVHTQTIKLSETQEPRSGPTATPPTLTPTPPSTAASTISLHSADRLPGEDEPGPPSFSSLFATPESAESAAAAARKNSSTSLFVVAQQHQLRLKDRVEPPLEEVGPSSVATASVVAEPPLEPLPSFASVVSENQASSAATAVRETKAALPRDTKDGAGSKDIDDGEPPPPYSEGSSPINSFTYVMASAGGPSSIITQVSQNTGVPINAIGGALSRSQTEPC